MAEEIGARHLELAAVASLETGKTRTESIVEVQEAIDLVNAYAGHVEENEGYTGRCSLRRGRAQRGHPPALRRVRRHRAVRLPRRPLDRDSAAALAAGNTVVFKPSEKTPACGALLAEAFLAALPEDVFGVVHGGPEVGSALVDGDVDGIAFTGRRRWP